MGHVYCSMDTHCADTVAYYQSVLVYTIIVETIETFSHQDQSHCTPHRGPTCQAKGLTKKGADPRN